MAAPKTMAINDPTLEFITAANCKKTGSKNKLEQVCPQLNSAPVVRVSQECLRSAARNECSDCAVKALW